MSDLLCAAHDQFGYPDEGDTCPECELDAALARNKFLEEEHVKYRAEFKLTEGAFAEVDEERKAATTLADRLAEALRRVQWREGFCGPCGAWDDDGEPHHKDCPVGAALADYEKAYRP